MTRKRVKKFLMAVKGIERDKAEEISRTGVPGFRRMIAKEAQKDIERQKQERGGKTCSKS